jgi:hypothetical protein
MRPFAQSSSESTFSPGYRCESEPGGFKLTLQSTQTKVDDQVEQIGK